MFWIKKFRDKSNHIEKIKTIRLPKIRQKGIEVEIDDIGNKIILRFGNAQHIGSRKQQEDSFGYSNISNADEISSKGVLAVLADGMGGLAYGKQISDYVVSAMLKMFETFDYSNTFHMQLEKMIETINSEISSQFSTNGKSGAGSTVIAILLYKTKLYWVAVGDSRIYILRDGFLYQTNEDHDYQNQLLSNYINGSAELREALTNAQKDSLTSYIGNEKLPLIDSNNRGFALQKGDTIVLCSDGIYNSISNAELIEFLKEDPQIASEKILKNIIHKKIDYQDNMTIMVTSIN